MSDTTRVGHGFAQATNQEALLLEALRSAIAELDDERYEREIWEGAAVGAWKRGNALKAERDRYREVLERLLGALSDLPIPTLTGRFGIEAWEAYQAAREVLAPAAEPVPPRVTDADFAALEDVRREVEQSGRQAEALRLELGLDAPDGEKKR